MTHMTMLPFPEEIAPDGVFDEAAMVRRLVEGDQSALSELYQQFSTLVYGIALRVVHNSSLAEEIALDTFLKVWRQPTNWNPERGRFVSWLLTIARYTAIDRLRKEQRRPLHTAVEFDDMRLGEYAQMDDPLWHDSHMLLVWLKRLPKEQMQVIDLAFFQGMSHREIADHLDLPLGTVKTRVRLGLQKLKSYSESFWGDLN